MDEFEFKLITVTFLNSRLRVSCAISDYTIRFLCLLSLGFIWKGVKKQKQNIFHLPLTPHPLSTAQSTKPCMSQEQVALCPGDGVGCSSPHPQTPLTNRTPCKGFAGSVGSLLPSVLLKATCAHVRHSVKCLLN